MANQEDKEREESFPHDAAAKELFSDPVVMASFLQEFVPHKYISNVELNSLALVSSSYTSPSYLKRDNDLVWRAKCGKSWIYLYVMLEFQSSVDMRMAERILLYYALLVDQLRNVDKVKGKMHPILPIVIYSGESCWTAVTNVRDMFYNVSDELSFFLPSLEYFLLEIDRIDASFFGGLQGRCKQHISFAQDFGPSLCDNGIKRTAHAFFPPKIR